MKYEPDACGICKNCGRPLTFAYHSYNTLNGFECRYEGPPKK